MNNLLWTLALQKIRDIRDDCVNFIRRDKRTYGKIRFKIKFDRKQYSEKYLGCSKKN